jgi:hypothetical protein
MELQQEMSVLVVRQVNAHEHLTPLQNTQRVNMTYVGVPTQRQTRFYGLPGATFKVQPSTSLVNHALVAQN